MHFLTSPRVMTGLALVLLVNGVVGVVVQDGFARVMQGVVAGLALCALVLVRVVLPRLAERSGHRLDGE